MYFKKQGGKKSKGNTSCVRVCNKFNTGATPMAALGVLISPILDEITKRTQSGSFVTKVLCNQK